MTKATTPEDLIENHDKTLKILNERKSITKEHVLDIFKKEYDGQSYPVTGITVKQDESYLEVKVYMSVSGKFETSLKFLTSLAATFRTADISVRYDNDRVSYENDHLIFAIQTQIQINMD